ncbi:peptidylprolyl isomerase [Pleurocapsales cyanobacterium LEGE 06147]|nr:peptidylprolyl isomerase [Pleurocapsales cyanobacterium LEGE 06147]
MSKEIDLSRQDILNYLKLSCQIPNILEGVITCKIIELKAAEIGITVTTEELQQAADDFRLTHQLFNVEATRSWLQRHHLSLDDFESLIYTNMLSRKLVEHLFGDRVESFFYEHQLDYAGVAMYEVVLDDEDLAMELFCALQEGEISFHEVARQYITQPSLRRSGGYRGIVSRRELKSEISAAVFAATPPQFLKPIITSQGVHLILVEEIIHPQLDEELRKQILSDLFSDWLKQQMAEVQVVTNLDANIPKKLPLTVSQQRV